MTVYNDSNGNYYSGSIFSSTFASDLITDIESIFNSLSISYVLANGYFTFRPTSDILTGTITAQSDVHTTANIGDQGRFAIDCSITTSRTGSACLYLLNSSNTNTEVTIRGDGTGLTQSALRLNVRLGSIAWAVANNQSLSVFHYKDASNWIFVSVGVVNNTGVYVFPSNIYGMYILNYAGTKYKSFRGVDANIATPVEFHRSGSNANYSRPLNNGITAPGCLWLPRRINNNYAIGSCPNLVSVTRSTITGLSLNIGDYPIDFNNLSTGNNNIDGSTQDKYIYVGNLDSTAGDDAGDGLFMRIYENL